MKDILEFRALVRRVVRPGVADSCLRKAAYAGDTYILSCEYALATPAQQAACVVAVEADLKALAAEPMENAK